MRPLFVGIAMIALAGCARVREPHRLPTGIVLDPAGASIALGSMPLGAIWSPDSSRIVIVLSGYRDQGIQVVDRATREVVQTIAQPAAFLGAAFSPDGGRLYVSGGNGDVVYEYAWRENAATLADSIVLAPPPGLNSGRVYPAGLACSRDGARLYVAGNLCDSLLVVDVAKRRVLARHPTGPFPYDVVVGPAGNVYVSVWGGEWIASFAPNTHGDLEARARIPAGRHPSALALDRAGRRLFAACAAGDRIAVIDTEHDSLLAQLSDAAPGGPSEGSTPNALRLSADGRRLYVAEADNDAVAVFDLGARSSGVAAATARDSLLGRIPVEWYPTAVLARGDSLFVVNGKGRGAGPNPARSQPGRKGPEDPHDYTLGQTSGSLSFVANPDAAGLVVYSRRVARAAGWDRVPTAAVLPPFRHVIYVVRENRTYDQVFGDLTIGDRDSSLTFFPRSVTPNAHALAERFGVYDRFHVNAEVSGDGHNWTMAAYASDYVEKTIPSNYSDRGRTFDYEGLNRGQVTDDDVNEAANGYLWDAARRAGITLRNFGEFAYRKSDGHWVATKPWLALHTDPSFPGWDLDVPDTLRAERWLAAFRAQDKGDSFPALTILRLPNDHTAGARLHAPTPSAYVADNDLALGRVIEAVSRSRYWSSTVLFVLEDDAQDGPDHVDSHRSPLLVVSPYNRPGLVHRFANTSDVVATIGHILGLEALSNLDRFGRPLTDVFAASPDTTPYTALVPAQRRDEVNQDSTGVAILNRQLDLSREDPANEALFNRILWRMLKGDRPYPKRAGGPLASVASH
jgi:DNA-binding beta-propeller fold protein YncE